MEPVTLAAENRVSLSWHGDFRLPGMSATTIIESGAKPGNAGESSTAFGMPRDFGNNTLVYTVVSPRAGGLSVGLNLTPERVCNFRCNYCEVAGLRSGAASPLDLGVLQRELAGTLDEVFSRRVRERSACRGLPDELLDLRHVALSGDGEPTLCPNFDRVVEEVVHLRACGRFPFYKIVLITNGTLLDSAPVAAGLNLFTPRDEIWVKLDAGSREAISRINQPDASVDLDRDGLLDLARVRPVVIQSLFAMVAGRGPARAEIDAYADRLLRLKNAGAKISLVQIYSASRPAPAPLCTHLPLKSLSAIARQVRETTGLPARVF